MNRQFPVIAAMFLASGLLNADESNEPGDPLTADMLTIGSVAPTLDIAHWVTGPRSGHASAGGYAGGEIYVVEFWATWCTPCVASMPHLAELQAKHAADRVHVIGVSDEDLPTVNEFLTQAVPENVQTETVATYQDVCRQYSLTTDPDRSVYDAFMTAAFQDGIPTSFIVGRTGHIEWIGHPQDLDDVLASVVDRTWDRHRFASTFIPRQKQLALEYVVYDLIDQKNLEGVEAMLAPRIKSASPEMTPSLKGLLFEAIAALDPKALASWINQILTESNPETVRNYLETLSYTSMKGSRSQKRAVAATCLARADQLIEENGLLHIDSKRSTGLDLLAASAAVCVKLKDFESAMSYATRGLNASTSEAEVNFFTAELQDIAKRQEKTMVRRNSRKKPAAESGDADVFDQANELGGSQ